MTMHGFPSDAAIGAAERAAQAAPVESINCADCVLPVPMTYEHDGVLQPVDGVFDGDDVIHRRCYEARCDRCGEALGIACQHRTAQGERWGLRSVGGRAS